MQESPSILPVDTHSIAFCLYFRNKNSKINGISHLNSSMHRTESGCAIKKFHRRWYSRQVVLVAVVITSSYVLFTQKYFGADHFAVSQIEAIASWLIRRLVNTITFLSRVREEFIRQLSRSSPLRSSKLKKHTPNLHNIHFPFFQISSQKLWALCLHFDRRPYIVASATNISNDAFSMDKYYNLLSHMCISMPTKNRTTDGVADRKSTGCLHANDWVASNNNT